MDVVADKEPAGEVPPATWRSDEASADASAAPSEARGEVGGSHYGWIVSRRDARSNAD